jgi:hypothetical protein
LSSLIPFLPFANAGGIRIGRRSMIGSMAGGVNGVKAVRAAWIGTMIVVVAVA